MLQNFLYFSLILAVTSKAVERTILLNDGNRIPGVAFGTFGKVSDIYLIKPAVIEAIEAGYRHIDTAYLYQNEGAIGEAIEDVINRGVVTREELWITTKLNLQVSCREEVLPGIQGSLERLKLDYIDLYLIHNRENMNGLIDYLDIWKGMEEVKKMNLTRSIGLSNFQIEDIDNILANSEIPPSVHEIEVQPSYTSPDLVDYAQSQNIAVMSYAPFGFLVPRPFVNNTASISFDDPALVKIAEKYGKKTSQVVLRYLIDRGTIPIPRSTNAERIKSNIDLFDFSLTLKEISIINKLNENIKVYNFDAESLQPILDYFELSL